MTVLYVAIWLFLAAFVIAGIAGFILPANRRTHWARAGWALAGAVVTYILVLFIQANFTPNGQTPASPTVVADLPSPTIIFTATAQPSVTFTPTVTASPLPTITATATIVPTATEAPFAGLVINQCPKDSLGRHPDTGQPLIFKMNPYPGDPDVLCEYEVWLADVDTKIIVQPGTAHINADWSHGKFWDDAGELTDACPTGWECEGTWVALKTHVVPAGTLLHVYVYVREAPAQFRFTQETQWFKPFACEYIMTQGHDMRNIRVPAWAIGKGTIYGFAFPLNAPGHLTCPGFETWDPTPAPVP